MSWLPGFFLRRFFSIQWLASHTYVDVRARHDPVSIRGGELPEIQLWVVVSNNGHFDIELDRLSAEFIFGRVITQLFYLRRTKLKPTEKRELFLRGKLADSEINHISKHKEHPSISLELRADFNSKIHNFPVSTGQLAGIRPEYINC